MSANNPLGVVVQRRVTILNGNTVSGSILTVQEVSTQATGGTFFLLFEGDRSTSLDFDASAAEVDAALITMPGITAVTVTGTGTEADPWIITFDTLVPASRPAGKLGVDERLLTGSTPTAMVRVTVPGEGLGLSVLGYRVTAIEQPASCEGTSWQFRGDVIGNGTFIVINADDGTPVTMVKSATVAQITRVGAEVATALAGYSSIQLVAGDNQVGNAVLNVLMEKV